METAKSYLEGILANRFADSTYREYLQDEILQGDSFYTRILASEGRTNADAALAKWEQCHRMAEFSACLDPVVKGLLDWASADPEQKSIRMIPLDAKNTSLPRLDLGIPHPRMLLASLPTRLDACGRVPHARIFSPMGQLQLQHLTIHRAFREHSGKTELQLGLIFPLRNLPEGAQDGLLTISIERAGHISASTTTVHLRKKIAMHLVLHPEKALDAFDIWRSQGGDFEEKLFPGAQDYLIKHLPNLGEFLKGIAAQIAQKDSEENE